MFKIYSWNVNGLRAVLNKGFTGFAESCGGDVILLQETKALPEQVEPGWEPDGYEAVWNPADRKGYSGTVTLTREPPLSVTRGIGVKRHDQEGRVLTLEFDPFYLVNVYTPNAQNELARLPYRVQWDKAFRRFIKGLEATKPVIFGGDLNVAHTEIDLTHPKANHNKNAGFTDEERDGFTKLLKAGYIDSFRYFRPGEPEHYSWWSFRANARAKNVGWRIDYLGVSKALEKQLAEAAIHPDVMGSDHCPVSVGLNL